MESKEYTYRSLEGEPDLTADVYYASSATAPTSGAQPIVIMFYGGGFVVGSKELVSKNEIEILVLELGFVVVVPNYRHYPAVSLYDGPINDAHSCYEWVQNELPRLLTSAGVDAEGNRVAVIGFSAGGTMALHLGAAKNSPKAILAFYPAMYFEDTFWQLPMTAFSKIPAFPQEFLDKINDEGPLVSAPSLFKKLQGNSVLVPDLSKPRNAWLLSHFRDGTWLRAIVHDGDYARVDPAKLFSGTFPPTYFVHGSEDKMCDAKFSRMAHEKLLAKNAKSKLVIAEGRDHNFDAKLAKDDPEFELVREAFRFVAKEVSL
ncbi:uncharacterized protein TRIVIDRAFT_49315 [Trichoderma virens Gv29-8]|uniref:Alpha/beta hydrolase fold-3 domain-containing protein n=1 Tax=Hypocrea virens (strain Gv29-8 / FGSC 10586) TaxID=413071 RepID=G9N2N7_HYPVG|nr:uncharacterized protein TRIVIDRAFT_49315 [Trichoderma virens Gv29-8]EHK19347.1 hypothetical protein TRIVIDRAFT_49315 [Trichoderma virens Gv29-8]UKZ49200.1 hypothetical protein TrVGV298_003443 [Trichoderma virens]